MPFVASPSSTDLEALELDGLHLNSDEIGLEAVAFPPPRQRAEWIGAADSEAQLLVGDPKHENREITANLVVVGGDKDGMLQRVGEIVDKLQKASKYEDGVELVWSPGGSTLEVTFDVLAGEITEMAVDQEWLLGNVAKLTVVLTAKPYWRGVETLTSTASSSSPFVTMEIANLLGDVPALGRLIVTDTATQSRRHVEWGLEGPLTYDAATSLLIDSDSMVTSGFGGTQTTQSGAYDPNASGNSVVGITARTAVAAVAGVGDLAHVGSFRVKARLYSDASTVSVRLSWKAADGPMVSNSWAAHRGGSAWQEIDLGTIISPAVISGTQRWTGQVEVKTSTGTATVRLDYLILEPTSAGYGKARGAFSVSTGSLSAVDDFDSTTAGTALNGRVAVLGGTWATSGAATDFAFADDLSGEQVKRTTTGDASARYAVLGSAAFTETQVEADLMLSTFPTVSGASASAGVIARWTDSSNFVYGQLVKLNSSGLERPLLSIRTVVAGSDTVLASKFTIITSGTIYRARLIVFASGRAILQLLSESGQLLDSVEDFSTALATGGTLASGKPGLYDKNASATAITRYYDNFAVSVPSPEPIVIHSGRNMQIRHDDTIRQDATGTYTGRPAYYRGTRFLVPVGTSRVLVKARRNDVDTATDDNVTDATQIQVGITPRGLAVPRA